MQRRTFLGMIAAGVLAPNGVAAQSHDGDANIFPGNAGLLVAPASLANLRYATKSYLGEIVPVEDSDRLPRVTDVIALEFEMRQETFRYTHSRQKVDNLYAALKEIAEASASIQVHYAYYYGHSFRDGVNRISRYDVFKDKQRAR